MRKPLGRMLDKDNTNELMREEKHKVQKVQKVQKAQKVFTLKSGNKVEFTATTIPHDSIEQTLYVDFEVNGRDQEQLTTESLSDLSTIKEHQFFPVIGCTDHLGRISILDGSRRMHAALLFGADLEVLVSDKGISRSDAIQLAKDIQTAKEHNLREIGLRLQVLKKQMKYKNQDIAKHENISESKVSRALQAASVHPDLIKLFDVSELSFADYKYLIGVEKLLSKNNISISLFYFATKETIELSKQEENNNDDEKELIMSTIKESIKEIVVKKQGRPKNEVKIETLKSISKNQFIKRKVKGRTTSYEFSRMPDELIEKIEAAISEFKLEE